MLWEAWQYYTTPASVVAKKMGFLEESIAMAARHKRCHQEWQAHYAHCQQAILTAVAQCKHKHKIVILGAGSLRDIPLTELSQQFEEILLVDLVFLKSARKLAASLSNVALLELDVSFGLECAFRGQKTFENDQAWSFLSSTDCLVSLNLLTQLPLIPVRWLMQSYAMTESEADAYAKLMIEDHLAKMNQASGVKCLIADRWIIEQDGEGNSQDEFDPAWEVPLPVAQTTWHWTVIPVGEVSADYQQVHQVGVSIW